MSKAWLGAVAVGSLVLATFPGLTEAGAATPPAVLQARTTASVVLPNAGGTLGSVEGMRLAGGSWTISSNVTAVNFGAGDYVRCQLQENGTVIDGGATAYLADRVGGIVDVGTFFSTGAASVSVLCEHDRAGTSGQFYIDAGATITAVHGGPISAPGITPSGTPSVVEARTSSAVSVGQNSLVPVVSATLPVGNWAITGNGSAVDFSASDTATCALGSNAGTLTVSYPSVGVGGDDAVVTDLDTEGVAKTPAGGATVTLYCESQFANDVYIDAGASITATRAAPSVVEGAPIPQVVLPDAGGVAKVVLRQTMPAGAWRVRSQVIAGNRFPNNSYGDQRDFIRCSLAANGKPIDGGATNLVTPNTVFGQIVNAGAFTAATTWTLTLSCSHDVAHTGPGHWNIVQGEVQAVNKGPIS